MCYREAAGDEELGGPRLLSHDDYLACPCSTVCRAVAESSNSKIDMQDRYDAVNTRIQVEIRA